MKERSNIQQAWHGPVNVEPGGSGYVIHNLLVRWNETTEEGTETEYIYDAHRIDVDLPPEISQAWRQSSYTWRSPSQPSCSVHRISLNRRWVSHDSDRSPTEEDH